MVYRIFKLRFAGWKDGDWLLAIQGKAGWIGMPSRKQAAAHLILASRSASRDGEFLQVVTKPEQDFQISYEMDPEKNDGTQKTVVIEFSALRLS
jgi:hypothetical protein